MKHQISSIFIGLFVALFLTNSPSVANTRDALSEKNLVISEQLFESKKQDYKRYLEQKYNYIYQQVSELKNQDFEVLSNALNGNVDLNSATELRLFHFFQILQLAQSNIDVQITLYDALLKMQTSYGAELTLASAASYILYFSSSQIEKNPRLAEELETKIYYFQQMLKDSQSKIKSGLGMEKTGTSSTAWLMHIRSLMFHTDYNSLGTNIQSDKLFYGGKVQNLTWNEFAKMIQEDISKLEVSHQIKNWSHKGRLGVFIGSLASLVGYWIHEKFFSDTEAQEKFKKTMSDLKIKHESLLKLRVQKLILSN